MNKFKNFTDKELLAEYKKRGLLKKKEKDDRDLGEITEMAYYAPERKRKNRS